MLSSTNTCWWQRLQLGYNLFKGFLKQDVSDIIKQDVVISRPYRKRNKCSSAFSISFAVESVELKTLTRSIRDTLASKIFNSYFFPFPKMALVESYPLKMFVLSLMLTFFYVALVIIPIKHDYFSFSLEILLQVIDISITDVKIV